MPHTIAFMQYFSKFLKLIGQLENPQENSWPVTFTHDRIYSNNSMISTESAKLTLATQTNSHINYANSININGNDRFKWSLIYQE